MVGGDGGGDSSISREFSMESCWKLRDGGGGSAGGGVSSRGGSTNASFDRMRSRNEIENIKFS